MRKYIILAICLVLLLIPLGRSCLNSGHRAWRRARNERSDAARLLGEALAKQFPGGRAVIIGNPYIAEDERPGPLKAEQVAGIKGLKKGFRGEIDILDVVTPAMRDGAMINPRSLYYDPTSTTPLSYLMAPDAFDVVAREHPQATILISLVGMAWEPQKLNLWKADDGPAIGLLLPDLRVIGTTEQVRQAFQSGRIAAAVLANPRGENSNEPYLVATQDSIDALIREYPAILNEGAERQK
jgi:hypothetical protein